MVTVYQLTLKPTGYIYIKIQPILHYHSRQSVCSFLHKKFSPFLIIIRDNLSILLHKNSAYSLLSFQTICIFFYITIQPIFHYHCRQSVCLLNVLSGCSYHFTSFNTEQPDWRMTMIWVGLLTAVGIVCITAGKFNSKYCFLKWIWV